MKNNFRLDVLQPADRLVLPKSTIGLVQHHTIYIGKDRQGKRIYVENAIGKGVQLVDETYLFRDGYKLTRVQYFEGNQFQRSNAVKAAIQLLGKEYDLINFNCEHYANRVQHGKSFSNQIETGLYLGVLAFILSIGFSK